MTDLIERLLERWLPLPAKYEPWPVEVSLPKVRTYPGSHIDPESVELVRPYVLAAEKRAS